MTFYVCIGRWARPAFRISWREMRVCAGFVAVCVGWFDIEDTTARLMKLAGIRAHNAGSVEVTQHSKCDRCGCEIVPGLVHYCMPVIEEGAGR